MKEYSLADAMHLLAITNRQLDRLLAIAGIDKQSLADASNKDKRRKLLSQEQFDTLASLHRKEPQSGDHEARILALEREVGELRALLKVQSISHAARPHATASTERRVSPAQVTQGTNWLTGEDGGIYDRETQLLTASAIGRLVNDHHGGRDYGRKTLAAKMPAEARVSISAALLWLFANYDRMAKCDDATCPCSAM